MKAMREPSGQQASDQKRAEPGLARQQAPAVRNAGPRRAIFATEALHGATICCYRDSDVEPFREELERFRYRIHMAERCKLSRWADDAHERLADPADAGAYHFVLRETGDERDLLGCARLHVWPNIPESAITRLNLGSFAVAYRHSFGYVSQLAVAAGTARVDYGQSLVKAVVEFSHWSPIDAEIVFSHCAPDLAPLYQAFGLRPFGQPFEEPDLGPQLPMLIIGGDVQCHEKTGPLLLKTAHKFRISDERLEALNRYLAFVGLTCPGFSGHP